MKRDTNAISIKRYRSRAAGYDASAERTMALRRRTIELLQLQPGQIVLDVGAGTGLSYALLLGAVGPTGRVLGFEQSPHMFALAEARVQREGWGNLWHTRVPAEKVQLPELADAVLFNFTHDILRTPQAVDNIMRQVKSGGRVAVAGIQFFPWWTGPLNLLPWLMNRPYNARAADLWHPWDKLQGHCRDFKRSSVMWGMGYLASGSRR